jgi:hypothetical protein
MTPIINPSRNYYFFVIEVLFLPLERSLHRLRPVPGISTFVQLRIGRKIASFVGNVVGSFVETNPLA